jgi:hypothetical protein
MNRAIDVTTEMRKLTSSKPLQAAAGAGALASEALRELPARIARWRQEVSVTTLPNRASELARWRPEVSVTTLPNRASEVVTTARAKAARGYDHLAVRGERVLATRGVLAGKDARGQGARAGQSTVADKSAVVSKNTAAAKSAVAGKSTAGKSTAAGKGTGNGKAR